MKKILILLIIIAAFSCKDDKTTETKTEIKQEKWTIATISAKIMQNNKDDNLLFLRARLYLQEFNYENAIKDLEMAIELNSNNERYYFLLSETFILSKQISKAKEILNKLIEKYPNNTEAKLKLANIYILAKNYKKADELLEKVKKIDRQIASVYFLKSIIYRELKDTLNAIHYLRIAVSKDQNFFEAYSDLAYLHQKKNDPIAKEYFLNCVRIKPDDFQMRYNFGMFYQENKNFVKAIKQYNYILKNIDKQNTSALFNIAYINIYEQQKYKESLESINKIIKIDKNSYKGFYLKSEAFTGLNMKDSANFYLEKAKEIKISVNQ